MFFFSDSLSFVSKSGYFKGLGTSFGKVFGVEVHTLLELLLVVVLLLQVLVVKLQISVVSDFALRSLLR